MSNIKDLTGTKIGKLALTERKREKKHTYYFCKCDYGIEKWIRADTLYKINSCGCDREYNCRDLTDKKFGMLKPIKIVGTSKDNGKIWYCKCDCGNYKNIPISALISGATVSCGCYQKERAKENVKIAFKSFKDKNIVEHTNIAFLNLNTTIKGNTSGTTGVYFNKREQKWLAKIGFKREIYFLGYFKEKEDAIAARKEAEEKYHKNFLEWYKNKKSSKLG